MTREEAIILLRANVMVACDTSDKVGYGTPLNKAIEQALKMAIKALEQEPILDKIYADIQKLRGCSCSCSDGIIDDVEDILDKYKAESEDKG